MGENGEFFEKLQVSGCGLLAFWLLFMAGVVSGGWE